MSETLITISKNGRFARWALVSTHSGKEVLSAEDALERQPPKEVSFLASARESAILQDRSPKLSCGNFPKCCSASLACQKRPLGNESANSIQRCTFLTEITL